jgi:acyl-[acyl carrier protein]--UDP-N-acetylglucosamine O-acyltransferase
VPVPRIDPTAVIGGDPEWRDFDPETDASYGPGIHAEARINAFVTVDSGVNSPTMIGASFLMAHVHVGHDARVGDHCELAPGARVGGFAVIEDSAKLGMNAVVLPKVVVGRGARIGAGAVVTKDVPGGEIWAGVPARSIHSQMIDGNLDLNEARSMAGLGREITLPRARCRAAGHGFD